MTGVSGLTFDEAFAHATPVAIEGLEVLVPSAADLIRNKRATGRMKDLANVEALEDLGDSMLGGPAG